MARGKKERRAARRAEAEQAEARAAREAGDEAARQAAAAGSLAGRLGPFALGVVGAVGVALSGAPEAASAFPVLQDLARVLLGVGVVALAFAASPIGHPEPTVRTWTRAIGLTATALGVAALHHRHPEVVGSPFAATHPAFVGAPTALAPVALAAFVAALGRLERPHAGLRLALTAALAWTAAGLFWPHYTFDEGSLPLATAFAGLDAQGIEPALALAVHVATLMTLVVGGLELARRVERPSRRPRERRGPWAPLVWAAPVALVTHHVLTPLLGHTPDALGTAPLGVGLALAGAYGLLALGARDAAVALDTRGDTPLPIRASRSLDVALPAVVLALYGLLKTHGMGLSATDENIYFYMAHDLAEHGRWPYVDYFFAHPPLHVVVPGLLFKAFGFSIGLAKAIPVLATALTGLAFWALTRRAFGRWHALATVVTLLFAAETLKASTNMTGINLTVMWLSVGLWAWFRRPTLGSAAAAGVCFGLAANTGVYSMAAICAALALTLFEHRGRFAAMTGAFAVVGGGLAYVFYSAGGDAYVEGVYTYHSLKPMKNPDMVDLSTAESLLGAVATNVSALFDAKEYRKDVFYHAHLWLAFWLAPALGLASWLLGGHRRRPLWAFLDPRRLADDGPDGHAARLWLVGLALFVQFALFRELYSFYFLLIYPVMAALLGYVLVGGLQLASRAMDASRGPTNAWAHAAVGLGVVALWSGWMPWTASTLEAFPSELKAKGERNDYVFKDAPVLAGLSGVVEALFWKDHRLKADIQRGHAHYLWNKKRRFATAEDIAAYVADNTEPTDTITGNSTMAPLIALLADRRLAAGEVDTNTKRFKSGLLDDETFWESICSDRLKLIVSASSGYFSGRKLGRLPTARRWLTVSKRFDDPELKYGRTYPVTVLGVREPGPDPNQPDRACRWEAAPAGAPTR